MPQHRVNYPCCHDECLPSDIYCSLCTLNNPKLNNECSNIMQSLDGDLQIYIYIGRSWIRSSRFSEDVVWVVFQICYIGCLIYSDTMASFWLRYLKIRTFRVFRNVFKSGPIISQVRLYMFSYLTIPFILFLLNIDSYIKLLICGIITKAFSSAVHFLISSYC